MARRSPLERPRHERAELVFRAALTDSAACVRTSPDGRLVCAASLAGPVSMHDAATGELAGELGRHAGGALAVAFHPSSSRVVTAGQDGAIHLVDVGGEARAAREASRGAPVSHLAWSSDGASFAAARGRSVLLHSADGEPLGESSDHASTVLSLCFSDALDGWITACYGGLHLISRRTLTCERHFFARTSLLVAAPSPCGRYVAAGAQEPVVRVWDLEGGDDPVHLEGYKGKIGLLAWGAEATLLATASGPSVVLWSLVGGDPHAAPHVELAGHAARVLSLVFTHGGKALWTGCADGRLRLYDLTKSMEPVATVEMGAPVHWVEPAPGGDAVFVATTDGSLAAVRGFAVEEPRKRAAPKRSAADRRASA